MSKKLLIIISCIACVAIVGIVSTVVILAGGKKSSNSDIDISYDATNVNMIVSATYQVGDNGEIIDFYNGEETTIEFTESQETKSGVLSPKENIVLTSENSYVVFRYTFVNRSKTNDVRAVVSFKETSLKNINVIYPESEKNGESSYEFTIQHSSGDEFTPYTYEIRIEIQDKSISSEFIGEFSWSLIGVKNSSAE